MYIVKDDSHGALIGGIRVLETEQHDCVMKIVHGSPEGCFFDI